MSENFLGYIQSAQYDGNVSVDKNVNVFKSYLNFCVDMIIPKKIVKCSRNNKPLVTNKLKELASRKKGFHNNKIKAMLKDSEKKIENTINACKFITKTK